MAQFIGSTNKSTKLMLEVTEGSYNINNNTSPVTVKAYLGYSSSNTYMYGASINITVSCTSCSDRSISFYNSGTTYIYTNSWTYLGETTFEVPHENDGSKSVYISASMSNNVEPSSGSASGSMTLATIPRASEISSMSNVYIGENTTINVNRKSSSFTHTITYSFGSLSGTIVTKSSSTGVLWTIPETFYGQMTNITQKNVTLYITTYNGNSQVGDRKSTTFTLRTRESVCKPDIDATIKDVNEDTLALTGNELYFVNGYSTIEVTYQATAKKSASISNVKVNNNTAQTNPYEFTATSVSETINVIAYDSRGYSDTKKFLAGTDYVFINYLPVTTNVTVKRKAPTSDELVISFSGNYFNDTFGDVPNELALTWKFREYNKYNPTDWEQIQENTLTLNTDYVLKGNTFHSGDDPDYESEISLGHQFDYRKNYEIQLIYSDKLSNGSVTTLGTKGIPIVNWNGDYFKVNGDLKVTDNILVELYAPYDYTNEDLTKIQNYMQSGTPLTDEEFKKYDINKDGVINSADYVRVYNYIKYGLDTTHSAKIKIQNDTPESQGISVNNLAFLLTDANDNEIAKINRNGYYYNNIPFSNNSFYSTMETKIGQWIDGKTIYRKVINVGSLPNNTSKTVATGVDFNNAMLVKMYGICKYSSNNVSFPLPFTHPLTLGYSIMLNIDNSNNIVITTGTDRSDYSGYVIIEYTKTTD